MKLAEFHALLLLKPTWGRQTRCCSFQWQKIGSFFAANRVGVSCKFACKQPVSIAWTFEHAACPALDWGSWSSSTLPGPCPLRQPPLSWCK